MTNWKRIIYWGSELPKNSLWVMVIFVSEILQGIIMFEVCCYYFRTFLSWRIILTHLHSNLFISHLTYLTSSHSLFSLIFFYWFILIFSYYYLFNASIFYLNFFFLNIIISTKLPYFTKFIYSYGWSSNAIL